MFSSKPWKPPMGWVQQRRGGWSPAQLSSLRGWWRSDLGITIATGVSQWADQSGNGNTLLQATGSSQPALTAGAINGLPALTFDGNNDSLVASFALTQPTTVFIVMSQVTWTNFDMMFDGGGGATNSMALQQGTASPGLCLRAGAAFPVSNALPVATFGLVTCIFNGASSVLQINNVAETTGDAGTTAGGGIALGVRGALGGNFGNIQVADLAVTAAVASAAERTAMKSYALRRYGIS